MNSKRSFNHYVTDTFIIIIIGIFSIMAVLPFIYVLVASVTPSAILARERFILVPKGFSLEGYRYIFSTSTILRAVRVSVLLTIFGTAFNVLMTILFAYPLAHTNMKGRRIVLFLVTFTMLFSGGIVPEYMIVRSLGLLNRIGSLVLPGAISTFNFVIFRNYFQNLPKELEESAMIDGAGYIRILAMIIIPVSTPLIATFVVIYGVGNWNAWFQATMYISDSSKWPIQVILRTIVNFASGGLGDSSFMDNVVVPPVSIRMCTIVVATMPILMVYPFAQKYFTKGLLIGSVKG